MRCLLSKALCFTKKTGREGEKQKTLAKEEMQQMTQREKEKDCSGLELDEEHLLRSGYRDPLSEQTFEVSTHLLHAKGNSAWDWQGQRGELKCA